MQAKIIVGLGWGDEGKGITTDFLCSKSPNPIVVRYCGGQQAGHNVVIGEKSHIHASYGSGTLRGFPSYLSEHCCFYPPNMKREHDVLLGKGVMPVLYIHPLAKLTTPYDVAYNRLKEKRLGHGSCGIGIGTTMSRNLGPYKLHAIDVINRGMRAEKLSQIARHYNSLLWDYNPNEIEEYNRTVTIELKYFFDAIDGLVWRIEPYSRLSKYETIIFEGAQGVMLDMDYGIFPNVTYSHTTSKNALDICKEMGIGAEIYYVTRCYQTRHGNGWMSNSDPIKLIRNEKEINVTNEWQGEFRTAELDYNLLNYAMRCDNIHSYWCPKRLVVTCVDQRPDFRLKEGLLTGNIRSIINSHSPDCRDFTFSINPYYEKVSI